MAVEPVEAELEAGVRVETVLNGRLDTALGTALFDTGRNHRYAA
jgi:hypothetical protein